MQIVIGLILSFKHVHEIACMLYCPEIISLYNRRMAWKSCIVDVCVGYRVGL